MSITNDVRAKADEAIERGRSALGTAQQSVSRIRTTALAATGQARDGVGAAASRAHANVASVAGSAVVTAKDVASATGRALDNRATRPVTNAGAPVVTQLRGYTEAVAGTISGTVRGVTQDPRVAKVLDGPAAKIPGVSGLRRKPAAPGIAQPEV